MINGTLKIFMDFDGTITTTDVGDAIFTHFGNPDIVKPAVELLLTDKISARECWRRLFNSVDKIDVNELNSFIDSIPVDPYLADLVHYFNENNIEFYVLSDGFDYYIDRIFIREGLSDIKYFSNKMSITKDSKLVPSFPYYDHSFINSANCKRNHIINLSSDEDYTILIGDGNSDKHTAVYCDFIFAKNDLIKFCQKESITYCPYKHFDDIIEKIDLLKKKKRLKKRHQAELKRKEIYMMEP
ncbi:MAG: MtnX-like HAD-IB family phosphatase [Bacteroidota bacterium]|nr:MtnX-like HAD-IB family phosphatase [Bacteroidota bacterium]